MSRGFVREDDQEEIPIVPQRAHLPAGVTNFVTPSGLKLLYEERQALLNEKENLYITNENERHIALNHLNARLQLLNERINGAKLVSPEEQPHGEVTFGASVTLRAVASGKEQTFCIVGVDEANASRGKISFLSPLAKIMINKKTGDKVTLKQPGGDVVFEIMAIQH